MHKFNVATNFGSLITEHFYVCQLGVSTHVLFEARQWISKSVYLVETLPTMAIHAVHVHRIKFLSGYATVHSEAQTLLWFHRSKVN